MIARLLFCLSFMAIVLITSFFVVVAIPLNRAEIAHQEVMFTDEIIPPLGLPPIPWPENNPYSVEKAELGRLLYYDKRLSSDQTISCASCHNRPCGYSDCKAVAVGIDQVEGTRHSPTIINSAYLKALFWDGRARSLEEQCKGPLANPREMTTINDPHAAHKNCVDEVAKIQGYKPLFKKAFGTEEISLERITRAIATFERTVLSGNSPYDRYMAGDRSALTQEALNGMALFKKTGCINCHIEPIFTDDRFHNIGIGMKGPAPDLGRYAITHDKKDLGAFKTPSLREVAYTGPYMHDGSIKSLREVIDYYNQGGTRNENLHPMMRPLKLAEEEIQALISFLEALSGEGWQQIVAPKEFPK